MKKILLSLVALLTAATMSAQVIFSENFDGVHLSQSSPTAPLPTGWTTYGDNLHTNSQIGWMGNNWIIAGDGAGGQLAGCASWTVEDRNVDRWAVTPQINVNLAGAMLRFDMGCYSAQSPETIKIKVSTTTNEKSAFTDVETLTVNAYETHMIDLSAYENQNIYIAFVNCGNGVYSLMDNVEVGIFPALDMEMYSVNIPSYAPAGQDITISGVIINKGTENITSFDAYFVVDGHTSAVTTVTGPDVNVPYNYGFNFAIEEPFNSSEFGTHTIEVFVTNINGDASVSLTNNSMSDDIEVYDPSQAYDRTILLEQFTGQDCGFCPLGAQKIQQALNGRDDVIWLAHHAGYGNDAMTTPEDNTLTVFYNAGGRTYAPAYMVDRTKFSASDPGPVMGIGDANVIANIINEASLTPSYATVAIESANYNAENRELSIHVTGTISESFDMTSPRLSVYLMEDSIYGRQVNAGNIYHMRVMRDAITDVWGDPINGKTIDETLTYTMPAKFKANHCKVVAFITDHHNDVNNRKVINSAITANYIDGTYNGIDEVSNINMNVYPNPAIDYVSIAAESAIRSIRVVNALGQVVYNNSSVDSESVTLNTSNYSAGMYMITINTDEGIAVRRLTVAR